MDSCLSADDLASMVDGTLDPARFAAAEHHVSECERCMRLLQQVGQALTSHDPATGVGGARAAALPRGTRVGRYEILEAIGAGAMGRVYSALDPTLDRRVALKLLHPTTATEELEARLLREAKAMARLRHPEVITIHDVGHYREQLFIAMELVEGGTLRQWLAARPRSWREVLDVYMRAGRGLAHAHAAGIIHRDFKPDNVLVDPEGRVRVTDFGLARTASSVEPEPSGPPSTQSGDATLTMTGMLMGTPAYMAPDQLRGAPADERSDQFSFCAALFEALYGAAPFEGKTLLSLLRSMDEERLLPAPPNATVPRWLRAIVARGLRKKPEDRYPSMRALLGALEIDPTRRRRRAATALIGVAALLVGGAVVAHDRHAQVVACQATAQRLDGAWDEARRRAVQAAFRATGRPYADDTFERVARVLGSYASEWSASAVASCLKAREVRSADVLAPKRAACLDSRLGELRAFVGVLTRAEGETVDRAVQGARALRSIEACSGKDPLEGASEPSDAVARVEAAALEDRMTEASALRAAGRTAESVAASTRNLADAERLSFAPLTARALLALAEVQAEAGQFVDAEKTAHRASLAGEAAGSFVVAARAWIGQAKLAAMRGDFARADERFDHAAVWVDRAGDDDVLRGVLLVERGARLGDEGRYDEARAQHLKALELLERAKSDLATEALNDLGVEADMQGRFDEARGYYEQALARQEQLLGRDTPAVARELNNLGLMAADQGKLDDAIRALERAYAIDERGLGPAHPDTLATAGSLANVLGAAHREVEALALAERILPLAEKAFGADTPDVAFVLTAQVNVLFGLKRPADALPYAERELAIRQKGSAPINLADAECDVGLALVRTRADLSRARGLLEKARAEFVAADHPARLEEIAAGLAAAK